MEPALTQRAALSVAVPAAFSWALTDERVLTLMSVPMVMDGVTRSVPTLVGLSSAAVTLALTFSLTEHHAFVSLHQGCQSGVIALKIAPRRNQQHQVTQIQHQTFLFCPEFIVSYPDPKTGGSGYETTEFTHRLYC